MSEKAKGSFFDKLPPTLIKKNNVTLIPEGAIGYLVGPTLALRQTRSCRTTSTST